jgi:hypothetical protein
MFRIVTHSYRGEKVPSHSIRHRIAPVLSSSLVLRTQSMPSADSTRIPDAQTTLPVTGAVRRSYYPHIQANQGFLPVSRFPTRSRNCGIINLTTQFFFTGPTCCEVRVSFFVTDHRKRPRCDLPNGLVWATTNARFHIVSMPGVFRRSHPSARGLPGSLSLLHHCRHDNCYAQRHLDDLVSLLQTEIRPGRLRQPTPGSSGEAVESICPVPGGYGGPEGRHLLKRHRPIAGHRHIMRKHHWRFHSPAAGWTSAARIGRRRARRLRPLRWEQVRSDSSLPQQGDIPHLSSSQERLHRDSQPIARFVRV